MISEARRSRMQIGSDERYRAVIERDGSFDGRFYTGVLTTGIYCKPSCTSRPPLRKNVRFVETREAAEAAGLRACKRCKPNVVEAII
jgi:AraC family transcriptional regulator of adaptative response/methylated-DNA-[protein]-cysteine methyltransferase